MTEEILALIFEYFKMDVLQDWTLTKEMEAEIIKTFTTAHEKKLSARQVYLLLKGSPVETLRNKIAEYNKNNYKPYPVRLGALKAGLQREAYARGNSLHRHLLFKLTDRKVQLSHYIL